MKKDIQPVHGTGGGKTRGWFFDAGQQWTDFFTRCNWYDFTVIQIEGEYTPEITRCELSLGLFGFWCHITYAWDDAWLRDVDLQPAVARPERGAEE